MRFVAPPRAAMPRGFPQHPALVQFAHAPAVLTGPWPSLADLNRLLAGARHRHSGVPLAFALQDDTLGADRLHYEARIFERGLIATRVANWHDLFNALVWLDRLLLKCAVNSAYVRELAVAPAGARTRAQAALTHFDEAGALVVLQDEDLLRAWDRHDWAGLFPSAANGWQTRARLVLFGHALLEHLLVPGLLPVAKCLVVRAPPARADEVLEALAEAVRHGEVLRDPQELRPLPLAGLPGWHAGNDGDDFYRRAPCFRPLRPGRRYPRPWSPDCASGAAVR